MRRARLESHVTAPETVAAALRPDDTAEIETRIEDGCVVSVIERETTSGLQATVDDYVVNLGIAIDVLNCSNTHANESNNTHDI